MNIKEVLEKEVGKQSKIQLNNVDIDPMQIRVLMINEVVAEEPAQDFYGQEHSAYLTSVKMLFSKGGLEIANASELLAKGIYLTHAVKVPKKETTVSKEELAISLPYLEKELSLFPNLQVIMLMGDVAKKAFNQITRKHTKKNVVPAISTYKLRKSELYFEGIRIMPSYIMTGGNILIEKSKVTMIVDDIEKMRAIIGE